VSRRHLTETVTGIAVGLALAVGLVYGIDHDHDLEPTPSQVGTPAPIVEVETITEDDVRWNCLTMGNRVCGPDYVPVTTEQADNLAEGDNPPGWLASDYPWESCLNDTGTGLVVCPDGLVVTP
jgi:hypothetical protein